MKLLPKSATIKLRIFPDNKCQNISQKQPQIIPMANCFVDLLI